MSFSTAANIISSDFIGTNPDLPDLQASLKPLGV